MVALQSRSDESAARVVAEVTGLTVAAFVVALLAGIVFVVPLVVLGYDVQTTAVLVSLTAAGQLGMFGLGWVYRRYRDVSIPISTPSRRGFGLVVGAILVALILAISLSALLAVLDLLPNSVIGETATTDPTYLLGLAALSLVVVAPVEEFLFRGVVQGRLRERFGPVPAIVGASLLFGSMHLANYSGEPLPIVAGALMISCVGAVFGVVYERTETLVAPILVHAVYNGILLLTSYLATSSI